MEIAKEWLNQASADPAPSLANFEDDVQNAISDEPSDPIPEPPPQASTVPPDPPSDPPKSSWQSVLSDELRKPLFLWQMEQFAERIGAKSPSTIVIDLGGQSSEQLGLLAHLLDKGVCPAASLGGFSRSEAVAKSAALAVPEACIVTSTTTAHGPREVMACLPAPPAVVGIVAAFTLNMLSPRFLDILDSWGEALSPESEVLLAVRMPPLNFQNDSWSRSNLSSTLSRGGTFVVMAITTHIEGDANKEIAFVTLRRSDVGLSLHKATTQQPQYQASGHSSSHPKQSISILKHMERMSRAIEHRAVEKELDNLASHSREGVPSSFSTRTSMPSSMGRSARRKVTARPPQCENSNLFGGSRRKVEPVPKQDVNASLFGGSRRKTNQPLKEPIHKPSKECSTTSRDLFGGARRPSGRKAHETTYKLASNNHT